MALKDRINEDLKASLLARDQIKSGVLRGLKAVILNEEVALGKRDEGLDDETIEKLIAREVKKRNESAAIYDEAGRGELAENERKEAELMDEYLPEQMSEVEIRTVIDRVIAEKKSEMGLPALTISQAGQVIGTIKKELGNTADGALIASIVKDKLS